MRKFVTKKIDAIHSRELFEQLFIDDKGQLDEFLKSLSGTTYLSEYRTLLTSMEYFGDGNRLPDTKYKDLTPSKEIIKEHEFKSKHLRIYAIQLSGKKLVIIGGYKNTQPQDIIRFRSLKEQFLTQQVNKKQ